jgi:large subunit ribosomal protein L9
MLTTSRKNIKLLLIENVDSLGIVGDVVTVRTGYARNFLLPRNLATQPDEKLIAQLAGKRKQAEAQMAQLRKDRQALTEKLKGVEIDLIRACNDQGVLYGAVTQQDIATALGAKGFKVSPRDVRITSAIKRIENADVHVKLDRDLDAVVKVHVKPDRELPKDTNAEGETISAGAAALGEGGKRDAVGRALEEAVKSIGGKTGWATSENKSNEAKQDDGAKSKGKKKAEDKGEAKPEAKAEAKSEDKPAKAAKAEKAPKAEKKK